MVHLTYPSMERQDLTQGQLGSFKFTPVDESSFLLPFLPFSSLSHHSSDHSQEHMTSGLHSMNVKSSETNSSLSNDQIRSNSRNSHLDMRPANVRTAIEIASSSPPKQTAALSSGIRIRPSANSFFPRFASTPTFPEWQSSTGVSNLLDVKTSTDRPDKRLNSTQSLLCALETEQRAHRDTRTILRSEIAKREEVESEIRRVVENNKSLLNSIKLLQSTVKHMVNNDTQNRETDDKTLEEAVCDFKSKVSQADISDSILYDAIKEQRHRLGGDYAAKTPTATYTTPFEESALNQSFVGDESHETQHQLELKCEVLVPAQSETFSEKAIRSNGQPDSAIRMIEFEPAVVSFADETTSLEDSAPPILKDSRVEDGDKLLCSTSAPSRSVCSVTQNKRVLLENGSTFKIPGHIINKYGRSNLNDRIPSSNTTYVVAADRSGEDQGKIQAIASEPAGSNETSATNDNPVNIRIFPALNIRWNPSLVDDLSFSRFPVRYGEHVYPYSDGGFQHNKLTEGAVPNMVEKNIFRTIMIDFIPLGASYKDLLSQIRGGALESIHIYEPIGPTTDFLTARVVFTHEYGAKTLYQHGQNPGLLIKGKQVRTWRVQEPTYQKGILEDAIYEQGYTRLLIIDPPDIDAINKLPRKLEAQFKAGFVVNVSEASDCTLMVEFTSVEEAWKALDVLMMDEEFGGTYFDFEEDYCENPYV